MSASTVAGRRSKAGRGGGEAGAAVEVAGYVSAGQAHLTGALPRQDHAPVDGQPVGGQSPTVGVGEAGRGPVQLDGYVIAGHAHLIGALPRQEHDPGWAVL